MIDPNTPNSHRAAQEGTLGALGVPTGASLGDSSKTNVCTRVRINFKIPFDHAELSKKVMSPYFPFNPYKEDLNGKPMYKSPMLKASKVVSYYISL